MRSPGAHAGANGCATHKRPRDSTQATPAGQTVAKLLALSNSRKEGLYRAHTEGGITMTRIATSLGPSVSQVSRLIARFETSYAKDNT
jgi:hypothetical protein